MRRLPVIAVIVGASLVPTTPAGPAPGPEPPRSFAFAIGNGNLAGGPARVADRLGAFDLIVIDGELASADEVEALRTGGATVLAYLSVGTIEKWRDWYPSLKRFRLEAWADWKDEWFADVSRPKLRRRLAGRIAPALLAKGFDGLFLDNVDMVETRDHRRQRTGMQALVLKLAARTHGQARLLFTQNGAWALRRLGLVDAIDGWNREDVTWAYDFDRRRYRRSRGRAHRAALHELAAFGDLGLITTATDYTRAGDGPALREAVDAACSIGSLPYVADIGLTARRLPDAPITCP